MAEFQMMMEWAAVIGLIVTIIQVVKLKWKVPGPVYPLIAIFLAIPLGLLNVYLPVWLPPLALFGIRGAMVAVVSAFGIVSIGQKMFEKSEKNNPQ
ncbi:hypothetical protein [Phosphitispora fastidiosa]|uniref:hypothetical protein n=1 Tax=Phosphitispora fastidiosa TaxID=2837202 RepID=UPI001E37C751|nr:hypothetical protein [Phosphitispora fastidiosa]MBU7006288.1 O-antigen/teichoic acid export membrane protein [Phosphitispora fastidiosa]